VRASASLTDASSGGRESAGRDEDGRHHGQRRILHDVVEDTLVSLDKIEELFGTEVAHIVDGVNQISQIPVHVQGGEAG